LPYPKEGGWHAAFIDLAIPYLFLNLEPANICNREATLRFSQHILICLYGPFLFKISQHQATQPETIQQNRSKPRVCLSRLSDP
jgi:hypothetical protein